MELLTTVRQIFKIFSAVASPSASTSDKEQLIHALFDSRRLCRRPATSLE